ncbi:MAG TPA: hypothetical protein VEY67_01850, partial [Candidatus Dormibacteraeota bacterium]|nr:hypothetical protein [Candidatus Dormibacteraeota bacterium]
LTAIALFAIALAVRAATASVVVFPIPEDTAYYVSVARNLVDGRGLVSDAIWSYGTPPLVFPRPAFEVWLPLPTLLSAAVMSVLGSTFAVAQLVPIVAGAVVAVFAWRIAADVAEELAMPAGRARTFAAGSGLAAGVYLPLVLHSTLPDSTMVFAALALPALWGMARILRRPDATFDAAGAGPLVRLDPRLLALGVLLGLAAWTRNEAAWLGVAWLVVVAWAPALERSDRLRLIAIPAVVAVLVFAPWAIRDWLVFGNPLPGQALGNALSVTGFDIFAWHDPPTLARYLAQGPGFWIGSRIDGFVHDLFSVLLLLGAPVSVIGLVALPWTGRATALRPLLVFSLVTFAVTTLVFPVSTTWGTFLHAAGPIHVLLVLSCLLALDALIVRVGRWRGWTRPVAWLGPALAIFASAAFTLVYIPGFGAQSASVARRYDALAAAFAAMGTPLASAGPVITDFPIWLAAAERVPSLALPNEPPSSVVSLAAAFPGTRYLVIDGDRGIWPATLASAAATAGGSPDAATACFHEVTLATPSDASGADALRDVRVWRVECP